MVRRVQSLLAVAAAVGCDAIKSRRKTCIPDEVAYAHMTTKTCEMNWKLGEKSPKTPFQDQMDGECWKMKAYNTDIFLSSTVYQHEEDGRCVLSLSGYHGALAGYVRGAVSLVTPFQTWNMCGNQMYAPYVRLMKHHTTLANWSKIANLLGGPQSTCKGDLLVAAESMGGSAAEIMAACGHTRQMHLLQDKSLPSFNITAFYTYGSPAASVHPIRNSLRSDGCFKGKRLYYNTDIISHFGGITKNLTHSLMDAVEIYQTPKGPTFRVTPCLAPRAVMDDHHPPALNLDTETAFDGKADPLGHMITGYADMVQYFQKAGFGPMMGMEPVDPKPGSYPKALQRQFF